MSIVKIKYTIQFDEKSQYLAPMGWCTGKTNDILTLSPEGKGVRILLDAKQQRIMKKFMGETLTLVGEIRLKDRYAIFSVANYYLLENLTDQMSEE